MSASPAVYEALAKSIVFLNEKPNAQNEVLRFLDTNRYYIDRIFDDPESGFYAIGFGSYDAQQPPVLVFRGTDFIDGEAIFSDSPDIGLPEFETNKDNIRNWLTEIGQDTGKNPSKLLPDVVGHSWGGAVAQIVATEYTSITGDIFTFNSPGVSRNTFNTFRRNLSRAGNKNVTHYIVSGDFVSLFGEAFIPGKVFIQSFTDPSINPLTVLAKHRSENLLTTPPAGFFQRQISVEQLNSPEFAYNNDSDFNEFIGAMNFALPNVSVAIRTRAGAESLRTAPEFSFVQLIRQMQYGLAPLQPNYLLGDDRNNTATGGPGEDTVIGNRGNDTLRGNRGNDSITGGDGDDFLYGGRDNDYLEGGDGNDLISGEFGNDFLMGGAGRDRFVLESGGGADVIVDFQDSEDLITLSRGLTFPQIRVTQDVDGALITIPITGEILASLRGVVASNITRVDFV
ncbi:calcium-binding protein [Microcoleus vaginatus GB1-A2]|uniref:calcium-binding protein n=1 Tax=Microcoleus vaginatus TaxID=119532 RepID=UPI001682FA78|nr:calcium-binding protein [Microcoleus sp. FACHB-61]